MLIKNKYPATILHIINSLEIGGAERVAIDLCSGLSHRGRRSILVTIEDGGPFEEVLNTKEIYFAIMGKKPGFRPTLTFKLLKLFREQNIQAIITHNYSPFRYGTIANLLYGNKPLIHVHHARSFTDTDEKRPISERLLAFFAKKIVAVSDDLKQNIISHDNLPSDKVCVIPNGIDENAYNVTVDVRFKKNGLSLEQDTFVLGCCARLSEQKGHIYLLKALAMYHSDEASVDWHLLLVGDGELMKMLQHEAQNLGIADRVSFLGSRIDVPDLLKVFDIFILTSIWEGMPLTILEAMAAARPIICTDVGGVSEVITNQKEGLLVPPRDIIGIYHAIKALIASPDLRNKLSTRAQDVFKKKYSLSRTLDRYEEIIDKIYKS